MKILDFIMGVVFIMVSTMLFMVMNLIMYVPSLIMALYIGMRRKGKGTVKTELNQLNKMFIANIKCYFHKYI